MPVEIQTIDIKRNVYGEYDLDLALVFKRDYCLITYNQVQVAQWQNNRLVFASHVTQQINLYDDVKRKNLSIVTSGPIYIDGALDLSGELNMTGSAVYFAKPVECQKLGLTIINNAIFSNKFLAKQVNIKAQNVLVKSSFIVEEVKNGSDMVVTGLFNVLQQAELSLSSCRLTVSHLAINGSSTVNDSILQIGRLDDNNSGESKFTNCSINASDEIVLNAKSQVGNVSLTAKNVYIRGNNSITEVDIQANNLHLEPQSLNMQGGSCKAKHIFIRNDNHASTIKSAYIETDTFSLLQGSFSFVNSVIVTNSAGQGNQMIAGELILDNTQILDHAKLQLQTWASGEGINYYLQRNLGACAHILNADMGSVQSIFSKDNGIAYEVTCNYLEKIIGYVDSEGKQHNNGFIHSDGGELKKPIVIPLNTETAQAAHAKDTAAEGGEHWLACVILPKQYTTPTGKIINNLREMIFIIDSLNQIKTLPPLFLNMIVKGGSHVFAAPVSEKSNQLRQIQHHIPAAFSNAEIVELGDCLQQEGDTDCGWWMVDNIITLINDGSVDNIIRNARRHGPRRAFDLRQKYSFMYLDNTEAITIEEVKQASNCNKPALETLFYVTPKGKVTTVNNSVITSDKLLLLGEVSLTETALTANLLLKERANMKLSNARVSISDRMFLDQGETTVSNSSVESQAIVASDQMKLGRSSLKSQSSLVVGEGMNLTLSAEANVVADEVTVLGKINNNESHVTCTNLHLYGQLQARNNASTFVEKKLSVKRKSSFDNHQSLLQSGLLEVQGDLNGEQDTIAAETHIAIMKFAKVNLNGSTVSAKTLHHEGRMVIDQDSKLKDEQATQLSISEQLICVEDSEITGDRLKLITHRWQQEGAITLKKWLAANSEQLYNHGVIKAGTISLECKKLALNLGEIDAQDIAINGNLINLLGEIYASRSLQQKGLLNLNITGLYFAANIHFTNVLSLNGGLIIPNLNLGLQNLLQFQGLLTFCGTFLGSYFPNYSNTIRFITLLPTICGQLSQLYNLISKTNWQSIREITATDVITTIIDLKANAQLIGGIINSTIAGISELKTLGTQGLGLIQDQPAINWFNVAAQAIKAVAPSHTDNSVLHVNAGVSHAFVAQKNNAFHVNFGHQNALLAQTICAHHVMNNGAMTGGEIMIDANHIDGRGMIKTTTEIVVTAKKMRLDTGGSIDAKSLKANVGHFEQSGSLTAEGGRLQAQSWQADAVSQTEIRNMEVVAKDYNQAGKLAMDGCTVAFENQQLANTADIAINDTTHIGQVINSAGKAVYKNSQLQVSAFETVGDASTTLDDNTQMKTTALSLAQGSSTQLLNDSVIDSSNGDIAGKLRARNSTMNIDQCRETSSAQVDFNNTKRYGKQLSSQGTSTYSDGAALLVDTVKLGKRSRTKFNNSTLQGELLALSKNGSSQMDNSTVHYTKGKIAGELKGGDNTITLTEGRETKTAQIRLERTLRNGKILRSQATSTYNNSEFNIDRVALGKYSQTKFNDSVAQGESLVLSSEGSLQINQTPTIYKQGAISGNLHVDKTNNFQIDHCDEKTTANITFNKSMRRGKTLLSKAQSSYKRSYTEYEDSIKFRHDARLSSDNAGFKAKKIVDASTQIVKNDASFEADEHKHTGNVKADKLDLNSHLIIGCKQGKLKGTGHVKEVSLDCDHLKDKTDFITGKNSGKRYKIDKSLLLITKDKIRIDKSNNRDCNIAIKADKISVKNHFKTYGNVHLQSTKHDVRVRGKIEAKNVYIKSKDDVTVKGKVAAKKSVVITAKETLSNLGGKIKARDNIYVKAHDIKNKSAGKIAAKNAVVLEARNKIYNVCATKEHHGKYGRMKSFSPSTITGGIGKRVDGYGVILRARKIRNDGSDVVSVGHNYLDGKEGIKFKPRQHTYIKRKEAKRKRFLGMTMSKRRKVDVVTKVQGSSAISLRGRNVLRSKQGKISATAANLLTSKGTDVYSKHKSKLHSLITKNKSYRSKSSLFGLKKSKSKVRYQVSNPTVIFDNGVTTIRSKKGDVDIKGTLILGNGDLHIKAGKRIRIRRDKLTHKAAEKTRSIGISTFMTNAFRAAKQGGSPTDVLAAEDSTIAKMQKLAESHDKISAAANASNLGIDLYNSAASLQANDTVTGALLERYRLGDSNGFKPTITATVRETRSKRKSQTLGAGGISRANITLQADKGIELTNGVTVRAEKDMNIETPKISFYAGRLRSHVKQKQRSIGVGVTTAGEFVDVSVGQGKTKSRRTTYVNSILSAGGHLDLGKGTDVTLNGGNIEANTIEGELGKLTGRTLQNRYHTRSHDFNVSTSSNISGHVAKASGKKTGNVSGIAVAEGINTKKHKFTAKEVKLSGTGIITDGKNRFVADKVKTKALHDKEKGNAYGISTNLCDLQSSGDDKRKSIPTISLKVSHLRKEGKQNAYIHGVKGTTPAISKLHGRLDHKKDGYHHAKDKRVSFELDMPVYKRRRGEEAGQDGITEHLTRHGIFKPAVAEMNNKSQEKSPIPNTAAPTPVTTTPQEQQSKATPPEQSTPVSSANETPDQLSFTDPQQEQEFNALMSNAQHEQQANKAVSGNTRNQLMSVLLKGTKIANKEGWKKVEQLVAENGGGKIANVCVTSKGLLFTYGLNVAAAYHDGSTAPMRDAAIATATDRTFGFLLNKAANGAAGPIGWALTACEVLDDISERTGFARIDHAGMANQHFQEVRHSDSYLSAQYDLEVARANQEIAQGKKIISLVANTSKKIKGAIKSIFETVMPEGEQPNHDRDIGVQQRQAPGHGK